MGEPKSIAVKEARPAWVSIARQKLQDLTKYEEGWDSYGGLPLNPAVQAWAFQIVNWIETEDLPTPLVGLGSGGTVQFEWRLQGRELEIEVFPDGRLEYLKVKVNTTMEEGEIRTYHREKLERLIAWLQQGGA